MALSASGLPQRDRRDQFQDLMIDEGVPCLIWRSNTACTKSALVNFRISLGLRTQAPRAQAAQCAAARSSSRRGACRCHGRLSEPICAASGRAADLASDRFGRRPARWVLALGVEDHAHRTLLDLRKSFAGTLVLAPCSIEGASSKSSAFQGWCWSAARLKPVVASFRQPVAGYPIQPGVK